MAKSDRVANTYDIYFYNALDTATRNGQLSETYQVQAIKNKVLDEWEIGTSSTITIIQRS